MNQLLRIKDSFIDYLSPGKRRRTTLGSSTPDAKQPTFLVPYSDPQDKKAEAAALSRLDNNYIPYPKNPRKRAREDDRDSMIFSAIDPDDSVSQTPTDEYSQSSNVTRTSGEKESDEIDEERPETAERGENEDEGEREDDASDVEMAFEVEEDEQISAEVKVAEYLARQAELELRLKDVEAFKLSGKHKDEIYLFERMSMRGFEELLPVAWQIDFPTLPIDIFTNNPDKTLVNSNCISDSRAVKALQSLLTLGVRVRDNVNAGAPTERLIAKEVRSYMKWAERDGGFDKLRVIPVLSIVVARPGQSIDTISVELSCQMKFLAEKHRNHLAIADGYVNEAGEIEMYTRPPPLLYGIIVAQTLAIFFTLDSADPTATVRHLTHAQFTDKKMDAWNEFAIALTVIVARNYIMSIKDELEPEDEDSDPDPDA